MRQQGFRSASILTITIASLGSASLAAAAPPYVAKWSSPTQTKARFAVDGKTVCKAGSTLSYVDGSKRCDGKTGSYLVLPKAEGYSLFYNRARIPGHTVIDPSSDHGLCVGSVPAGSTKVRRPGIIRRGTSTCQVLSAGKVLQTSSFQYVVAGTDDVSVLGNSTNNKGNGFRKPKASDGSWVPFSAVMLGNGAYLCAATTAWSDNAFGVTWIGSPPGGAHGKYCKVVNSEGVANYTSSFNVALNQWRSSDTKGKWWMSFKASAGAGETAATLPGSVQVCRVKKGGTYVLGARRAGGCKLPDGSTHANAPVLVRKN